MCSYMLFLFLLSYSQSEQRHLPGSFTILDTISASSAENTKLSYEQVQTIISLKDSSRLRFAIFDATFASIVQRSNVKVKSDNRSFSIASLKLCCLWQRRALEMPKMYGKWREKIKLLYHNIKIIYSIAWRWTNLGVNGLGHYFDEIKCRNCNYFWHRLS